ncbi:MAG: serine/threonine protein kinase [Myxococcales bacterium]|nr:serine/threonine protein kinase [Myxococcales bacterium]
METYDPAWIARTVAELGNASRGQPEATIGQVTIVEHPEEDIIRTLVALSAAPELRTVADGEKIDPLSPHLYVRGILGEGGIGIVELAHQPLLNRDVAVKRLRVPDPRQAALLLREAKVTGSLEHANIIPIHALGIHPKLGPLVVMKRIQGVSWDVRLASERAQIAADEDVLATHVEILTRVCLAVEFAHSRGVFHRDLKPANVMLGDFGELYVVDWGLALERGERVEERQLVGSPAYMPPEMAKGEPVDERSDVFLLGATLHQVISGELRHAAPTVVLSLMRAAAAEPHEYDDRVPAELAEICNRACHPEPAQRFPDVATLRAALLEYLAHRRATAVLRTASRQHERFRMLLDASLSMRPSAAVISAAYHQVLVCYEQALDIWGGLSAAQHGKREAMIDMLRYELAIGDIHGAERIVGELAEVPAELRARLDELIEERKARRARLSSLEEEVDMQRGRGARTSVIGGILVAVALINLAFFLADPSPAANAPPRRLLVLVVVVASVTSMFIVGGWRRLTANLAGRQYIRFVIAGLAFLLVNRVRGYILDDSALSIMSSDLLGLGACICIVRVPLPGMMALGLAVAGAGLSMVLLPGYSRLIFLVVTAVFPLLMLGLDRLYRRVRDHGEPLP